MAQVKIVDATQPQLLWFAQVRLGMKKVLPNTGRDKLVARIQEAWTEDFIETDDHMPADGNAGPASQRGSYGNHTLPGKPKIDPLRFGALDPLVKVQVHADRHKGGDRPVPAHLNGVEYWIPRGVAVDVPLRYFRVLEEGVGDIHDGWDDKIKKNSESRQAQSYTYTVHRQPSAEEIARWEKMMQPYLDRQRKQKMARIHRTRIRREDEAFAA